MKILVTGTSGFIGKSIYQYLEQAHSLSAIEGREEFAQKLSTLRSPIDVIIHCGFEIDFTNDFSSYLRNMETTKQILTFANKMQAKLVFVSAAGTLGVSDTPILRTEACFNTTDPTYENYLACSYIHAKIDSEFLIRKSKIFSTILYLTTVYGPGMDPYALRSLQSKVLPPGGTSFLHLNDLLKAIELILLNPKNDSFILNSGNATYRELASAVGNKKVFVLPKFLLILLKPFLSRILLSSFGYKYYDSQKFKSSYHWIPESSFSKILNK